jgi:uncharacterized protein YyaL (SSP411 family)
MINKHKTVALLGFIIICLTVLVGCGQVTKEVTVTLGERNQLRSKQMSTILFDEFLDEQVSVEYLPAYEDGDKIASVWHYTGLISLSNRLRSLYPDDETIATINDNLFLGLEYYREKRNDGYLVYAVNRGMSQGNAMINNVYDDQMWLAREFVAAYENTNDVNYLNKAKDLVTYIISGWDDSINPATGEEWGGIYWGPTYTSKHTCSNAPIIGVLVDMYYITEDASYLNWAKKIYDFTYTTLRLSDGTYGDMIGTEIVGGQTISHGGIDESRYSYNSGAMITAGVELYRATSEEHYLTDALVTAKAAYEYFGNEDLVEGYVQYPASSTTWFNLVLLIGFVDLNEFAPVEASTYIESYQKSIDYSYDNFYKDGYLPVNWVKGWIPGFEKDEHKNVLDHSSHAETYALLAQFELSKK